MREDDFVADEFLCRLPVALDYSGPQTFLIDLAAAEPNVLRVVHIAKNISQEHFVGFYGFARIVGNRRGDKPGHVYRISGLAGFCSAGGDVGGANSSIVATDMAEMIGVRE